MALSDCNECWETPCVCGADYVDRSDEWILNQIEMLRATLVKRGSLKIPLGHRSERMLIAQHEAMKELHETVAKVFDAFRVKTDGDKQD